MALDDESRRLWQHVGDLGQAHPQGSLAKIAEALEQHGFTLLEQDLDGFAHRFVRDDDQQHRAHA